MHETFFGERYHDKVRQMLKADNVLLPNCVIDADTNIGGAKIIVQRQLEYYEKAFENFKEGSMAFKKLQSAALYFLSGILCLAMQSRTSTPPFSIPKYKKNWDAKRNECITRGNLLVRELVKMG